MSADTTAERLLDGEIDHDGNHVFHHTLTPSSQTDIVKLRMRFPDCIPIYPVRYGLVGNKQAQPLPDTLDTSDYPALNNGKQWGLRVLRPRSFVYLLYKSKTDGDFVIKGFHVTDDVRFKALSASDIKNAEDPSDDEQDNSADHDSQSTLVNGLTLAETGVLPYIPAPGPDKADSVQLLVCDTILSEQRCQQLKANQITLSSPWNKTISSWRDTVATKLIPQGDDQQENTFDGKKLSTCVPEMRSSGPSRQQSKKWSESQPDAPDGQRTADAMNRLVPATDAKPNLAVAIHDPVGAVSELNNLLGVDMAQLQQLSEDASYKLFASQAIDTLVDKAVDKAENSARNPTYSDYEMGRSAEDISQAAGQSARAERLNHVADDAKRQAFVDELPSKKKKIVDAIQQQSLGVWTVFNALESRYVAAAALNDVATIAGFEDCQNVAAQTLSALTQCKPGLDYLHQHTPDTGPTGMPGWMLAGHPDVANYVAGAASAAVTGSAMSGGQTAGKLEKLLEKFVPRNESRMLSLMMAGLKSRGMKGPYQRLLQLWEGKLIQSERMTFDDMLAFVKKQHNAKGVGPFRPSQAKALDGSRPSTNAGHLYDMQTVKDVEVEAERAKEFALASRERFWRNLHVGLSGLALVVSAWNAKQAYDALGRKDGLTFANALSAAGGTFATASAGAAVGDAANQLASRAAKRAGDEGLAGIRRTLADKCATFMIGLGSAAAVMASIQHGIKAANEGGEARVLDATVAGIDFTAWAIGFYAVFGPRVGALLTLELAELSIPWAGWILFAATALDAIFSYWSEVATHNQAINEWIARSTWGNGKDTDKTPFSSMGEAVQAYLQLVAPPTIDTDREWGNTLENAIIPKPWEKTTQATTVKLPNWHDSESYYSITNTPGWFDGFLTAQKFSNIPAEIDQGAKALPVKMDGKVGKLQFESKDTGTIEVKYWPYGATADDFILTASNS